jgi:hypothetical protein
MNIFDKVNSFGLHHKIAGRDILSMMEIIGIINILLAIS